jgi:uncharacterized repeat protein (TIGR01451 family)
VGYAIALDSSGNVYVAETSYATWGSPVRSYSSGSDAFVAVLAQASFAVSKTGLPNPVALGGTLAYTIPVTNTGAIDALNVTVTDTLPSSIVFRDAAGTGWSCAHAAGVVTCTRPLLAPGAAPAITINVQVTVPTGELINNVSVSATNGAAVATATASVTVAAPIPMLNEYGLILLLIALGSAAILLLRN